MVSYSRDVQFYETIFPFKMNSRLQTDQNYDATLNDQNFFNENHSNPNDERRGPNTPNDGGDASS